MEAAIKTAVGVLLFFAAVMIIIVVVRSGYERRGDIFMGDTSVDGEGSGKKKKKKRKRRFSAFRSKHSLPQRTAKRQEAAEKPADPTRRFVIFGGAVGAVIVTLLVKLWSMQVISSDTYAAMAESNARTTVQIRAPRGRILDRNGTVLVDNRSMLCVMATADVSSDRNTLHRLSAVLGIPFAAVRQRAMSTKEGAQADRVIATDASDRAVAFISEHPATFPGVFIETRTERIYPYGTLAAHVLGYTGTISEEELAASQDDPDAPIEYQGGDIVGKTGAEYAFESVLQGIRGERTVEVDAGGNVISVLGQVDPQIGNDVELTIDYNTQVAAEAALASMMDRAQSGAYENAKAGAVVCLDVEDGGVLAMASAPTFDPSNFIGGVSTELWDELNSESSGYPLSNRAIAGLYPAASTFKAFTGMAGLSYGYCTRDSEIECTGVWTGFGNDWPQKCWESSGHGDIKFVDAIVESCDVYFYEIARQFYRDRDAIGEDALQQYLTTWGFGSKTGIDIPGESQGRVPTPEWKAEFNRDTPESAGWLPGDVSNLVIGQGDLLVTPLQICEGYLTIAGNGTSCAPHVLKDVLSHDGQQLIVHEPKQSIAPEFDPAHLALLQEGLEGVVSRGHVMDLFAEMAVPTAGKTGTGEVAGKDDYAWYVGYGPVDHPKYVCACIVEQGGSGGTCAAPVVRQVLATAMGLPTDFSFEVVEDNSR